MRVHAIRRRMSMSLSGGMRDTQRPARRQVCIPNVCGDCAAKCVSLSVNPFEIKTPSLPASTFAFLDKALNMTVPSLFPACTGNNVADLKASMKGGWYATRCAACVCARGASQRVPRRSHLPSPPTPPAARAPAPRLGVVNGTKVVCKPCPAGSVSTGGVSCAHARAPPGTHGAPVPAPPLLPLHSARAPSRKLRPLPAPPLARHHVPALHDGLHQLDHGRGLLPRRAARLLQRQVWRGGADAVRCGHVQPAAGRVHVPEVPRRVRVARGRGGVHAQGAGQPVRGAPPAQPPPLPLPRRA